MRRLESATIRFVPPRRTGRLVLLALLLASLCGAATTEEKTPEKAERDKNIDAGLQDNPRSNSRGHKRGETIRSVAGDAKTFGLQHRDMLGA